MNTLPLYLAAYSGENAPIMVKIIFWVLLILWAIGSFGFRDNPNWVRGNGIVILICLAILGYYTFGF